MPMFAVCALLLAAQLTVVSASASDSSCAGEFELCETTNDCVLLKTDCGKCAAGLYLCPLSVNECVSDVSKCTTLSGTIWDWTLPLETRVEWLLNAATLDEQILQLQNSAPSIPRLAIPAYQWLNDDLHGIRRHHATSFPNGCGLGATWDPSVLRDVGKIIAIESRAMHHYFTGSLGNRGLDGYWNGLGMTIYGPNVNLVRDPRWGRNQEVYSEDPLLTSKLTEGYVTGMQTKEAGYMTAASCCKHFAVYDVESFPEARYFYDAVVDGRNLWETYLPVFESCVKDANVSHIMCSYNSVNGVPACGNGELLNGILRGKWNFTGFVVSDYDAWAMIYNTHAYCPNMTCAAAVGINAGCDQEGGGSSAISELPLAISLGHVKPEAVAASFRRLFRVRVELGMFDPPSLVPFSATPWREISSDKHLSKSLEAARESICLYKNRNKTLPLASPQSLAVGNIAVIGGKAGATSWLQGNYAESPTWGVVSILEAVLNANAFGAAALCTLDLAGVDYHLPNDTFVPANDVNHCKDICMSSLNCNYFTFSGGRCYVMPTSVNRVQTGDTEIVSGARPGLCLQTAGIDYTTKTDVAELVVSDARECCQLCRAYSNCTKYTFNVVTSSCYLNPSASEGAANPFAISGTSPSKSPNVMYAPGCNDGLKCVATDFDAAAKVAAAADAAILVVGLDQTMESEGNDRESIFLPQGQYDLFTAVRTALGSSKPLIVVMVHGGTFALLDMFDQADAVVDAWYPGQQGGNAVVDVLYGNYNPGGKAAATFYQGDIDLPPNLAQQDLYHGNGITYRYYNGTPVIPFGFGLSYTNFTYGYISINSSSGSVNIGPCDDILVSVTVFNMGLVMGDEVVQLYLSQTNASVPVPRVRLADFVRVKNLMPGTSQRVTLRIQPMYRSIVIPSVDGNAYAAQRFVEPENLTIFIGGGQPNFGSQGMQTTITTTGTATNLDSC
mmetsp:Transcript_10541/g.12058  ORF Transcript_10541/g.12058 Transcript_10541/m.12058 type:complete len:955 (-) Transcript_10541:4-2868(-)